MAKKKPFLTRRENPEQTLGQGEVTKGIFAGTQE
jgi:hypothetical protein